MKKFILILSFLMISVCSYALVSDIGLDPLDQTSGAKPLGLGGAFAGASNDVNCLFYNPASLAHSKGIIVTAKDIKNFSLGVAYETGIGNFGVGTVYNGYEDFTVGTVKTKYENSLALFSYGTGPDWLSFGIMLKAVLSQRLSIAGSPDQSSIGGNDYDAGILWKPVNYASIGLIVRNVQNGSYKLGSSEEAFPRSTRAGIVLDLLGKNSVFHSENLGLKAAFDSESGDAGDNLKQNSFAGLEGSYNNWLFLRFGGSSIFKVDSNVASSSFGLGFKYEDAEIDMVGLKDPITEGQISYVSLSYSPREFVLFRPPEEVKTVEVKPMVVKKDLLRIDFPKDDHLTYDENIVISGETRPKAVVLINGVHAYVEIDGKFKAVQPLISGKNLIEISATLDSETKTILRKVLKKAKVIIEEEKEINNKIVQEGLSKEAEITKKEEEIKKDKEKGVDVTQKEKDLVEVKTNAEEMKGKLLEEKKKIDERKEKVENLVTLGVIEVSPEAKFEIEAPITRGEMISWLVKATGLAIPKVEETVLIDVPKNHKYAPYIKAALDAGYLTIGSDGKFRPDDPAKQEEGQAFFKAFGIVK
jgi:hypothetical protein